MAQCNAFTRKGSQCKKNSVGNRGYCYIHSFGKIKGIPFWKNSTLHGIIGIILTVIGILLAVLGPTKENQEKMLKKQDETLAKLNPQAKRPYLSIDLKPGPGEYLQKDGNSNLFFISCYEKIFLVLPFKIRNIGTVNATKITAEYSSPAQDNVEIKLGEKANLLAASEVMPETSYPFRVHINISNVVAAEDERDFKIELKIHYYNYEENIRQRYSTKLELIIFKENVDKNTVIYKIKGSKLVSE